MAVPGFCDAGGLRTIEAELSRFIAERVPALPAEHVFYEDKSDVGTLKQIQRMHEHDDFFGEFFEGTPKRLAEELLGEVVVGKVMNVCATFDHRFLDGVHAAALARVVQGAMEKPFEHFGPIPE